MLPKKSHCFPSGFVIAQPSLPKLRQSCPSELFRQLRLEFGKTLGIANVASKVPELPKVLESEFNQKRFHHKLQLAWSLLLQN